MKCWLWTPFLHLLPTCIWHSAIAPSTLNTDYVHLNNLYSFEWSLLLQPGMFDGNRTPLPSALTQSTPHPLQLPCTTLIETGMFILLLNPGSNLVCWTDLHIVGSTSSLSTQLFVPQLLVHQQLILNLSDLLLSPPIMLPPCPHKQEHGPPNLTFWELSQLVQQGQLPLQASLAPPPNLVVEILAAPPPSVRTDTWSALPCFLATGWLGVMIQQCNIRLHLSTRSLSDQPIMSKLSKNYKKRLQNGYKNYKKVSWVDPITV